jgi:hypothetical protein
LQRSPCKTFLFISCLCNLSFVYDILENLIIQEPLGIVIAGAYSSNIFDKLISLLSERKIDRHIMTGLLEEKSFTENAELFFISTWPSEERFIEWKDYRILFLGKGINETYVIENVKKVIE